ncbi:MAG: hypothetical protein AABW48_04580 [Nanoarchaeota archaeon]
MVTDEKYFKIMRLFAHYQFILAGAVMGVMTGLMTSFMGKFVEAIGDPLIETFVPEEEQKKAQKKIKEGIKKVKTELPKEMKEFVAEFVQQAPKIYALIKNEKKNVIPSLTDKFCDQGLAIVEKYPLGLKKLTEELDEDTITAYVVLSQKKGSPVEKMITEITAWLTSDKEIFTTLATLGKTGNKTGKGNKKSKI